MALPESDQLSEHAPLFAITVAAELAGMHAQTLRQYDRLGLVEPQRTKGGSRRYSLRDVRHLRQIQALSKEGISLPGIARILDLENEVETLRERARELEEALADERLRRPGARTFLATHAGEVQVVRAGQRAQRRAELVLYRGARPGRR